MHLRCTLDLMFLPTDEHVFVQSSSFSLVRPTRQTSPLLIQIPFDTGDEFEDEGYEPPANMNPFIREIAGRKKRMRRSTILSHTEETRAHAEDSLSLDDMTLRKIAGAQEAEQVKISGSGTVLVHSHLLL